MSEQNGWPFTHDIFKLIFFMENYFPLIKTSPQFFLNGLVENNSAMGHIIACDRTATKPLTWTMMTWFMAHICVTRPQRVRFFSSSVNCMSSLILSDSESIVWSVGCYEYKTVLFKIFVSKRKWPAFHIVHIQVRFCEWKSLYSYTYMKAFNN